MKTISRKILLSVVLCFALVSARGQFVTISDPMMVNAFHVNGLGNCLVGNQLDTTCPALLNAIYFDCYHKFISDLTGISYCDSLQYLSCGANYLTSLPPLPPKLKQLSCIGNLLDSLPALPVSLVELYCYDNNLSELPVLPASLLYLDCSRNYLYKLPILPDSLRSLYFSGNWLDSLQSLQSLSSLLSLDCSDNQDLDSLPDLPLTLRHFECWGNSIRLLPDLPPFLEYLNCRSNGLDSLANLPSTLTYLDCSSNHLAVLPSLPSSLATLQCAYNMLTSLPTLPISLQQLYCWRNQLSSIPPLPPLFKGFDCELECSFNQLTSLPDLPDTLWHLYIDNNPIACLPPFKWITDFRFGNTNITCFPNRFHTTNFTPALPVCNILNVNNCPVHWNIMGQTYTDSNSNCSRDSNEQINGNIKINLYENGNLVQQTFTNNFGQYSFSTDTLTYSYFVDSTEMPFGINCPLSGVYTSTITSINQFFPDKDFSLGCKSGFDVGTVGIVSSRFRPSTNSLVNILAGDISNHYNLHCASGISGTVTVIINGPASFNSVVVGALAPVVNGDTLTYAIPDYGAVNFNTDFSFIVQTDSTAQAGDQVCFDVSVTPLAGDTNPSNNNYTQCFTVRNSYDPNEKEVYPSGIIDTSQHYLTYTIYFQNTGNDTAQHVYILDTLDNDIDESSVQLLAYSHEPLVQVMGNVMKFNFPNINLVDSTTDEPHSHGYVQYRVRLKDGLVPGTIINNTAHIVFDFNTPVVTNTTFNQIDVFTAPQHPKGEHGVVAEIYPNPVESGGELKLLFNGGERKEGLLTIYDLSGRKVFEKKIISSMQSQSVGLPRLVAGVYACMISADNARVYKKMVVTSH